MQDRSYSVPIEDEIKHKNNESGPAGLDQKIDPDSSISEELAKSRETAGTVTQADKKDKGSRLERTSRQNLKTEECLRMLQRLKAEFDNYRKRVRKEHSEIYDYVRGDVFRMLLPVIDDLERLLNSESSEQSLREGIGIIYKNLMTTLQSHGLESFTDEGNAFDPNVHEAVSVEETEAQMDGKIVDTWLKGYRYKGRLLRPAKVKVGQKNR
ncbi:MAG TPA: nucleotide exchange factor GrpE [Bacteroidetes bacterium]|nr:nucleotide exchange factor GrpE [Bacteroidota bacterium]